MKKPTFAFEEAGRLLFAAPPVWRAAQAEALANHLRVCGGSALYRGLAGGERSITAENVDDVVLRLPRTTKDQLSAAGAGAWAAAPGEVREWVCTSGTSGLPLDVPLTAEDLDRVAINEACALSLAGMRAGDVCLLAVGMERLFVAGLAYWLGAQAIGCACVRVGPQAASHPRALRQIAERVCGRGQRTWLIAVPSFLVEADPVALEGIVAIGEPIRSPEAPHGYNALGARLHERFGCPVLSTYAATETCTTLAEGPLCRGGHVNPSLAVVEVLREDGSRADEGAPGEVTVTPLGARGLPLLRFQTGDIAALYNGACPCGRTTPRLGPVIGRKQQLLKVRGTSVYPAAILEALRVLPEVADACVVAERETALSDRVTVHVSLREGGEAPRIRTLIEGHLRALLRVTPAVGFLTPEALKGLQASTASRKAVRFIDRR